MEQVNNEEESDIVVNIQKTEKEFILTVKTTAEDDELTHPQALSGMIAGYAEACRKLDINYLEYFLDEFGIDHDIHYRNEEGH